MISMIGAGWLGLAGITGADEAPAFDPNEQFMLGVRAIQERKFASAAECFERAVKAQPVFPDAYNNWGIALVQMGRQTVALDQQLLLYQQAADKFSKAADQNPKERLTFLLWSEVLVLIGDMPVDGRVRLGCYQGAVDKCKRAAALAPTEWETYNKWGAILSNKLPDFATDDKTRVQLYREAAELFAKAAKNARFSSEVAPLYTNWGSALVRAARLAINPDDKVKMLTDACEKFERAAKMIPGAAASYLMWGNALIERGKLTRMRSDYRDAIDRLNTCISLNPKENAAYYNLARVYAVQGNNVLAKETLKKLATRDPQRVMLIEAARDPDFAGMGKDAEFIELVNPGGTAGFPGTAPRR
ncbi:MAG: hypothetical protein PCFJNLEI_03528 [Verrucomicrobiae bacterium]|nr:hypothetical protein [Verrucomicrobiae bacterium]